MNTILIISNGHGEDLLGALLARQLAAEAKDLPIAAYPVVGEGGAYRRAGVEVVGVQKRMPTGGFILKGAGNLWKDLKGGLIQLTRAQIRDLRPRREQVSAVIAMGDVYPLILGGRYIRRPLVFVPTAKSEHIRGHYGWEYALMRRYAGIIFPRDERTHRAIAARGLPSEYVGNLMMDALEMSGEDFGLASDRPVVTLLPGSRQDAYQNCVDLLQAVEEIGRRIPGVQFLLSLAPELDRNTLAAPVGELGWRFAGQDRPNVATLTNGALEVHCVQGLFGDVLRCADIVIGLAGTGNEQAAGLGKPVVTFPGRGTQFTPRFAFDQKRLLGEAVSLVERDPHTVAAEVVGILGDRTRYEAMAAEGRARMGEPGAARRMAQSVIAFLRRSEVLS